MNVSAEQLEFVVREVMRRLSDAPPAVSNSTADSLSLHVAGHVLSAASLEGRLNGVERVIIGKKTIVTPAAADALKERSVALVRADHSTTMPSRQILLAKHGNVGTSGLEHFVRQWSMTVRTVELTNCQQLGGRLNAGEPTILLTNRPYEAACHANRDERACAVFVADAEQCKAAMNEVAVNVLVVNANKCDTDLITTFLNEVTKK